MTNAGSNRIPGLVGKILLSSAVVMFGVAAAVWLGWIPLMPSIRPYVSLAFTLAGVVDGFLGFRFLGERGA